MVSKKETTPHLTQEENTQVQHLLEQRHQIANELHNSGNRKQAEAALSSINDTPEATQLALIKALVKEKDNDAADILLAINELSPNKPVRKEARRGLIQLEAAKIYPQWGAPTQLPVLSLSASNPPRFWKGFVTQAREEGEVQLVLCWEQGFEYSEVRMMIFLLDFWEQGLKEFIIENTTRRNVDAQIQHMKTELPDITVADCTLAEGRRLIEEALAVNRWRGTEPHKEYRHHLPTVTQLILNAVELDEDHGYTFINPGLEPDEVAADFVAAWSLGDFGLCYDLLASDSSIHEELSREEWIEQHQKWADEAHPARFELSFVHEREARSSTLWLPTSTLGTHLPTRKEVELAWSLEITETPLSGIHVEMPMGTAVNKETGRHWFWTSYTLVQEVLGASPSQSVWRISRMTDEGANAQALSITELQKLQEERDKRVQEIMQQHIPPSSPVSPEEAEEVIRLTIEILYYEDALIAKLPLDRSLYENAFSYAMGVNALERAIVYLERMAQRFPENRAAVLRQLGATEAALGDQYTQIAMNERANRFYDLAETAMRNSLDIDKNPLSYIFLGELAMRREDYDDAATYLEQARALTPSKEEEAQIEFDLGAITIEREQYDEALHHYQRVEELTPNRPGIWFNIGYAYRHQNNLPEAELSYKRSIELQPDYVPAYSELSAIYMNTHQEQKAYETIEQGLKVLPDSAHLQALLASILYEMGNTHRAEKALEEAERINPNLDIVQAVRQLFNSKKR